jgi:DNA-binding CsgD family transcriptional regulator
MEEIAYDVSFDVAVSRVCDQLNRWFAGPRKKLPEIDCFPEPVYLKSSSAMIVHANAAYHDFFAHGMSAAGRLATSFLDNSVIRVSEHSDALILSGADQLQFEHHCLGPNNRWFKFRTFKKSMLEYQDVAYDILGISRPLAVETSGQEKARTDSLEEKHLAYSQMEPTDRRICNLIAEGRSTKEIASVIDVTSKTIENRRRKILDRLEHQQPIDIVKTMVRFEERGFTL